MTESDQHTVVVFSQDISTSTVTLIDYNVETIETVYPTEVETIAIDITTHQELVSQLTIFIEKVEVLHSVEILSILEQIKD